MSSGSFGHTSGGSSQSQSTMAGPFVSTSSARTANIPTPRTMTRFSESSGKTPVYTSSTVTTPSFGSQLSFLTRERERKIIASYRMTFGSDIPADDLAPLVRRIKEMLNTAMRHGVYFGIRPWKNKVTPLGPTVNFDYGLNPRAILFPMYKPFKTEVESSEPYDNRLLLWYAVNAQSPSQVFSVIRIIKILNVVSESAFQGIISDFRFTVRRADLTESNFTLADVPWLNPADIATLARLCKKKQEISEMKWLVGYFEKFLELLFKDYCNQDVDLGAILRIKPRKPDSVYTDSKERIPGEILHDGTNPTGVYFELDNRDGSQAKRVMNLLDLGLFSSSRITDVTHLVQSCSKRSRFKKQVLDRFCWIIDWRTRMKELANEFFPQVFNEVEFLDLANRPREDEGASGSGAGGSGGGERRFVFSDDTQAGLA